MLEDMLQETAIYQYILQQGVAKGIVETEQQELQDFRQVLLGVVQAKFPNLVAFAHEKVDTISSIKTMKDLTLKIATAQTSDEIRQLLRSSSSKRM